MCLFYFSTIIARKRTKKRIAGCICLYMNDLVLKVSRKIMIVRMFDMKFVFLDDNKICVKRFFSIIINSEYMYREKYCNRIYE